MKNSNRLPPLVRTSVFLMLVITAMSVLPAQAVTIINASFDPPAEDTADNLGNGYGPISDWTRSGANVGVNDQTQPFLNQTAHSGTHVAFIQNGGSISQSVAGFDPSKLYTVTYFTSERGNSGTAETSTRVSLDGGSTFSATSNVKKTGNFRRIVSGPLAVSGSTSTLQLNAIGVVGDNTLLVDTVSISRAVPVVPDGGFENPFQPAGAYKLGNGGGTGTLTGSAWGFGSQPSGITSNGSAFTPPAAPEGSQAGLLRSNNIISTMVSGFEAGVTYSLSLEAAARNGTPNDFQVILNGVALTFGSSATIDPATGSYTSYTSDSFTTAGGPFLLELEGQIAGDRTVFVDDLRFNFVAEAVPEPSSALLAGLGLVGGLLVRRRGE